MYVTKSVVRGAFFSTFKWSRGLGVAFVPQVERSSKQMLGHLCWWPYVQNNVLDNVSVQNNLLDNASLTWLDLT
jgi:hypothetical protein